jgi:hypothetical protein
VLGEEVMAVKVVLPPIMSEHVREKVERRGIYEDHVEELVLGSPFRNHVRQAREGGLQVYGRDRGGRYLLLILYASGDYPGKHVVATCREMTEAERRLYQDHVGG